jgi:molybdopterin-containing oxidoreductase family iron-sulfur binding subunit
MPPLIGLPPDWQAWALSREAPAPAAAALSSTERRHFMRLMAASLAMSGLAGCDDDMRDEIVPPVSQAAGSAPGRKLTYASSTLIDGFANGVTVTTRDGRPLKIEGNAEHPWSGGGTDAFGQASVLGLYDPFRSQIVRHLARESDWQAFRAAMVPELARFSASAGEGFAILLGPSTSPSLAAQLAAMQAAWPRMRLYTAAAATRAGLYEGTRRAFGVPLETHWRFDGVRTVVCLDGDLLDAGPHQVGAARGWARARAAEAAHGRLLSLFAAAPVPNLTCARADYPISADPSLIALMSQTLLAQANNVAGPALPPEADRWCSAALKALRDAGGASVVQAGLHASPEVVANVARLNGALGNIGRSVLHTEPLLIEGRDIGALAEDMQSGAIEALLMIGADPAYDAPADLDFLGRLRHVRLKIHAGLYEDATALNVDWHLPMAHPLESWGDARSLDGTASLIQPTIAPLYDGRTASEILSLFVDREPRSALALLRAQWGGDDARWTRALLSGVIEGGAAPLKNAMVKPELALAAGAAPRGLEVVFRPDPTVWDGAFADNAWLQELPKPLTKIVWENVIGVGPGLAARFGLENGDLVELRKDGRSLTGPVWIETCQAGEVVCVTLGYGKSVAGQLSAGLGYDAYRLRESAAPWRISGVTLRKTGESRVLATTQSHTTMEGHDFVRVQRMGDASVGDRDRPLPSLYARAPDDGRAWGMVIDLDSCIGCNACVTACQAENNIAVVGREAVAQGREMHWLRIDLYQAPAAQQPAATGMKRHFMPVPCMQCEQAPCEVGCPVEATLHDHEGLNLMVYNRCVGTRACSGYCPYKVRRFNYADYSAGAAPSLVEQRNPEVTARARGVMEKCTYCVQRIAEARIVADRDDTPIADGAVRTACQAACPTEAILFGDLADSGSAVRRAHADPRRYALLGELNTRPRTTYLAARAPAASREG